MRGKAWKETTLSLSEPHGWRAPSSRSALPPSWQGGHDVWQWWIFLFFLATISLHHVALVLSGPDTLAVCYNWSPSDHANHTAITRAHVRCAAATPLQTAPLVGGPGSPPCRDMAPRARAQTRSLARHPHCL